MRNSTKMILAAAAAVALLQPAGMASAQHQHEPTPGATDEQGMPAMCQQMAGEMQGQMAMMQAMQDHMAMMQSMMGRMHGMAAADGNAGPMHTMMSGGGGMAAMGGMMDADPASIDDPAVAEQKAAALSEHLDMMKGHMAKLEQQLTALRERAQELRDSSH